MSHEDAYIECSDGTEKEITKLILDAVREDMEKVEKENTEDLIEQVLDDVEGFGCREWPGKTQQEERMNNLEKKLDRLINVQEQMAGIMEKLNEIKAETQQTRNLAQEAHNAWIDKLKGLRVMEKAVNALEEGQNKMVMRKRLTLFKKDFFINNMPLKRKRDTLNAKVQQTYEPLSSLWEEWNALKEFCAKMLGTDDKAVWGMYYQLVHEEPSKYDTFGDTETVDLQVDLNDPLGTLNMYADSHLAEEKRARN